jgi:hypothetical protein
VPFACTITKAYAVVTTAPATSAIIVDINNGATSIWNSGVNRLTIAASATTGTQTTINNPNLVEGDLLSLDIDQIGTGTVGANLTVEIKVTKS